MPASEARIDPRHPKNTPRTGYLPTLDGWRAIAILLVFAAHLPPFPNYLVMLNKVRGWGDLAGVDLFFAISGILICSRLLEEERLNGHINLLGFYIRRIFRIQPAAYLYLVVIALLALVHFVPMDWHAWQSSLFFFRNYVSAAVGDTYLNRLTGHFWSLAVEEHFYFVLPFLLVAFPRHRKAVLGVLLLIATAWVIWYLGTTSPVDREIIWRRRTDFRITSLLFPAWLALFIADPATRLKISTAIRSFRILDLLPLGFVVLLGKHLIHVHLSHGIPLPPTEIYSATVTGAGDIDLRILPTFVIPVFFPFIVISTMLYPGHYLSRILEWKILRKIGRVSYSLYLWQQLFFLSFLYVKWPFGHVPKLLMGLATLACALLSYFIVEKPLIRLGHRLAPPATPGHRDLRAA